MERLLSALERIADRPRPATPAVDPFSPEEATEARDPKRLDGVIKDLQDRLAKLSEPTPQLPPIPPSPPVFASPPAKPPEAVIEPPPPVAAVQIPLSPEPIFPPISPPAPVPHAVERPPAVSPRPARPTPAPPTLPPEDGMMGLLARLEQIEQIEQIERDDEPVVAEAPVVAPSIPTPAPRTVYLEPEPPSPPVVAAPVVAALVVAAPIAEPTPPTPAPEPKPRKIRPLEFSSDGKPVWRKDPKADEPPPVVVVPPSAPVEAAPVFVPPPREIVLADLTERPAIDLACNAILGQLAKGKPSCIALVGIDATANRGNTVALLAESLARRQPEKVLAADVSFGDSQLTFDIGAAIQAATPGIGEWLSAGSDPPNFESLIVPTGIEGLACLSPGHSRAAARAAAPTQIEQLLACCRKRFPLTILDGGPAGGSGSRIVNLCDAVYLVVYLQETEKAAAVAAANALLETGARFKGCLVIDTVGPTF